MQPADQPQNLVALGLRIQRRKGRKSFQQPCSALQNGCCKIYAARPERCRRFECQQLRRLAAGTITEASALEKIRDVQQRVSRIETWLQQAGATDVKRPLSKRCEKALAEPLHSDSDEKTVTLHRELTREMAELDAILDADFRVEK